jgi:tyrosine-protein phosphatase YwqE
MLHTAAEYYLDDHFDQSLNDNTPLLTIKDNWLLVEFSFVAVPVNLKQTLFNLQISGYQPILAHPERYLYFADDKKKYDELRDAGYFFQLNLLSLTGYYGKGPQELAEYLIKKKYIDLLGTDLHHDRHLRAYQSAGQLNDQVKFLMDTGNILNPTLLDQ